MANVEHHVVARLLIFEDLQSIHLLICLKHLTLCNHGKIRQEDVYTFLGDCPGPTNYISGCMK